MAAIRRRGHEDKPSHVPHGSDASAAEPLELVSTSLLEALKKKRKSRRPWLLFLLGGLLGVGGAVFFAQKQEVINLEGLVDFNLESLVDVIPSGILKEARDFNKHEKAIVDYDSFAVGLHLQAQGIAAKHPVIMIPGIISTGIESWSTASTSRQYFRKRLWGSWTMMRAMVLDKAGWKRQICLDKETGLDPEGIKLRAAQGFDATDFFITGYWIWNKILENLATIGYDPSNAFSAAYDWRLSYANLERRDQYFSRLRAHIELAHETSGEKPVLISHSMGGQVLFYFLHWVEHKAGPGWVDEHVDSWINVSGSMLGALKSLTALLSGEMKDTAQLNAFAVYGLEKFLGRDERREIFQAMPGVSSLLPMGGNAVWGNSTWAPDDPEGSNHSSYGAFISFKPPQLALSVGATSTSAESPTIGNLTVEESLDYLLSQSEPWYRKQVLENYSQGVAHSSAEVEANEKDSSKWINPLETRLPLAPNLKIYCFYGVGKSTERSFIYREERDPLTAVNVSIDTGLTDESRGIDHGVILGEGDGTVPLLSMGYMCSKGWKLKRYNPAGIEVKTIEMMHEPDRFSPRGGPNTGDHVDILGRSSLNDMILRIAGGRGEDIQEAYLSRIREYADRVQVFEE